MRMNRISAKMAMTMLLLSLALPATASDFTLGVFGNANEDDTINMQDVTYIELIILEYRDRTELADAKYDGKINTQDVTQIELIINGKEKEITVKDATDRIVTINQSIERVVTLFPVATEMVYAFEPNNLVGVDGKSHEDPRFGDLIPVGDGCNLDYEAIDDLDPDPDLVITVKYDCYTHPDTIASRTDGEIPVICIRVDSLDESMENIGEAYSLLGYIFQDADKIERLLDNWGDDAGNDDGILEYSVTTIEDYSHIDDLAPYGQEMYEKVEYWLKDHADWNEHFYVINESVDESDFGTSNNGDQGLDEADFHYHFGHGGMDQKEDNRTEICLRDWEPGENLGDVRSQEVEYKWDEDNEWVLIHSCHVLRDHDDWKHALKYSHAVMGFETITQCDSELPDKFFEYATNDDKTVYDAYRAATEDVFGSNVTAAVIFDTEEQMDNDHLWGEGVVMPDEHPDDNEYWYKSWNCKDD
jgi:hypothetical protein